MKYLDANVFLHAVLESGPIGDAARRLLKQATTGDAATSTLTVDEVVWSLWKIEGRDTAVAKGRQMIAARNVTYMPVTPDHLEQVLDLVEGGMRPRDAIHAAVALEAGIQEIVSTDPDFDKVDGLKRILLE